MEAFFHIKVADEVLSIFTAFDFERLSSSGHRSLWRTFCTYEGLFRIFVHMGVRCTILNIHIVVSGAEKRNGAGGNMMVHIWVCVSGFEYICRI